MLHYIRDISLQKQGTYDGGMTQWSYVLFHFLRTAGWGWLWECDTIDDDPNHCVDGDMAAAGDGNWADVVGGTSVKNTTTVHMLEQSLAVTAPSKDDGVQSDPFTTMASSETYQVSIWANNNTGASFDVLADDGGGSHAHIGTIPDNGGVFTRYDFSFLTDGGAGARSVQVLALGAATGALYIGSINVFRSWFENVGLDQDHTGGAADGDIVNGDEIDGGSYTFLAGDIGKVVCVWDPINLGNSGAYKIVAVPGGNAQLDLRVAGAETLTNTVVGNLAWRLVDFTVGPADVGTSDRGAGWGLESPHSSSWRLFFRHKFHASSLPSQIEIWSSATDVDFSVVNGVFSLDGVSNFNQDVHNLGAVPYVYGDGNCYGTTGGGATSSDTGSRMTCMTSEDGSFVALTHRQLPSDFYTGYFVVGYSGDDARHTGAESFIMWVPLLDSFTEEQEAMTDTYTYINAAMANGLQGGKYIRMQDCKNGELVGNNGETIRVANAKANQFSSEEWIIRQIALRDLTGVGGEYSEKEWTEENALWLCRENLPDFQTFDSGDYLHIENGIAWKWSGVTVNP